MIQPTEFNVVLKQDPTEEKTRGGVILTADIQERGKHMATRGTIVALAPLAFNADIWPEDRERPKPGDRVVFAQHAGMFLKEDGEEYRVVKDRDIVAVLA